jgi:hypothetical protein
MGVTAGASAACKELLGRPKVREPAGLDTDDDEVLPELEGVWSPPDSAVRKRSAGQQERKLMTVAVATVANVIERCLLTSALRWHCYCR